MAKWWLIEERHPSGHKANASRCYATRAVEYDAALAALEALRVAQ